MDKSNQAIIEAKDVATGYGRKEVLAGVSVSVSSGQTVAIIGHNGAGKSTLLKALFGMIPMWRGEVRIDNVRIRPSPRRLLDSGIAYVPQGNRVFSELSVEENIRIACIGQNAKMGYSEAIDRSLIFVPELKGVIRKRAGLLSGGQKQMLALARAMVQQPRILLLDEPSLGLSPKLVPAMLDQVARITSEGRAGILIVEQKVREVMRIADSVMVLRAGNVTFHGNPYQLTDERLRDVFF